MELFSINKISQMYNVPKSTLRYWEEKGLIQPERNSDNDYRMYDLKELIHIGDIVFYRNLGFSINQLRPYRQMSGDELNDLLTNAEQEVEEELAKLHAVQQVIKDRKEKLAQINLLSETEYIDQHPDFNQLASYSHLDPLDYKAFQENNPSDFTLHFTFEDTIGIQESLIVSEKAEHQTIIWQKNLTTSYLQTLLKIPADIPIDTKYLDAHIIRLGELGFQTKAAVARYLGTTSDSHSRFEYYKTWFEVEYTNPEIKK